MSTRPKNVYMGPRQKSGVYGSIKKSDAFGGDPTPRPKAVYILVLELKCIYGSQSKKCIYGSSAKSRKW